MAGGLDQIRLLPEKLLGTLSLEAAGAIDGQLAVQTAQLKTPSPEDLEKEKKVRGLSGMREALVKVSDDYREIAAASA